MPYSNSVDPDQTPCIEVSDQGKKHRLIRVRTVRQCPFMGHWAYNGVMKRYKVVFLVSEVIKTHLDRKPTLLP